MLNNFNFINIAPNEKSEKIIQDFFDSARTLPDLQNIQPRTPSALETEAALNRLKFMAASAFLIQENLEEGNG